MLSSKDIAVIVLSIKNNDLDHLKFLCEERDLTGIRYQDKHLFEFCLENKTHLSIIRYMASVLDLNEECSKGYPLFLYAINKHASSLIIEIMLNNGANIETKTGCGNTALANAVYLRRWKIVNVLLNRGADPDAINSYGETPRVRLIQYYHRINNVEKKRKVKRIMEKIK